METKTHEIIFDIKTESCGEEQWIREFTPDYPPFDPGSVKTGDCHTEEKRLAKIANAKRQGSTTLSDKGD